MIHTSSKPFLTLACRRTDRPRCVRDIFVSILDAGMQGGVVVSRPTLDTYLKAARLGVPRGRGFRVFPVSNGVEIKEVVRLLVDMPMWHKPIFHVLIGGPRFKALVVGICNDNPRLRLVDFEIGIEPYVLGFLDPLDDELECYGEKSVVSALSLLSTWTVTAPPPPR